MHTIEPPRLETFDHWPSWLNAREHVDRSACFELKVSEVRRLAGCVPMGVTKKGKPTRLRGREQFGVPDLPNERSARSVAGRLSSGWYDVGAWELDWVARGYFPRRLGGDWRTGRAPAMRREAGAGVRGSGDGRDGGMSLKQGGYGVGSYAYEVKHVGPHGVGCAEAVGFGAGRGLDAGLTGNPNRGACREKRFGLDDDWVQRLWLEKWERAGVGPACPAALRTQYFLICPGAGAGSRSIGCANAAGMDQGALRSSVDGRGLRGLTGTTSNCGDGSGGAHGAGWVCGQRVYKLFWVLAREAELRDARLAERWINGLTSAQLSRQSGAVSALVSRYGAVMGGRLLRCRRCLRLRYGQSPEVLRKKRRARGEV